MILDGPDGWGSVSRALHWLMALLILGMFTLGWVAVTYPMSPMKLQLFIWHKSIGLTLLALVVVRLFWRIVNVTPAPPPGSTATEQRLARASHAALYVLMFAMPLSGYVVNSTANFPFRYFGGPRVPNLVPADEAWQRAAEIFHLSSFWVFALLIATHAAAAIRHHAVKRDNVLVRMWGGSQRR